MVDMGPVGPPNQWAELRSYWSDGPGTAPLKRTAAIKHYSYVQHSIRPLQRQRKRRYTLVVTEDKAGRRTAITRGYDPERGVPEAKGAPVTRAELPPLPKTIILSAMIVFASVMIALFVLIPFGGLLSIPLTWWLLPVTLERVQRMRLQVEKVKSDHDLPPVRDDHSVQPRLLTPDELDARLTKLSQPDEDRTHDEPAPIPMPRQLRDPAWARWRERNTPASTKRDSNESRCLKQLMKIEEIQDKIRSLPLSERAPYIGYVADLEVQRTKIHRQLAELARPEPVSLDEPELDRPFKGETDCAEGHVGAHYAGEIFTGTDGVRRIRRACRWCPSTWSDTV